MTGRLVVAAVVVLALAAAGDALRRAGSPTVEPSRERAPAAGLDRVAAQASEFAADGSRLPDRVLRAGKVYLSAEAIADAFPVDVGGPVYVAQLDVAKDGTLALGVYRFPSGKPLERGIELWRDRRLIGAFSVPPGFFGGGLAFIADGTLSTFGPDGDLRAVYDRRGRPVAEVVGGALTAE